MVFQNVFYKLCSQYNDLNKYNEVVKRLNVVTTQRDTLSERNSEIISEVDRLKIEIESLKNDLESARLDILGLEKIIRMKEITISSLQNNTPVAALQNFGSVVASQCREWRNALSKMYLNCIK